MKRFAIPLGILTSIILIALAGFLGYVSVNSTFAIPVSLPSVQQGTPTAQVKTTPVTRGDWRSARPNSDTFWSPVHTRCNSGCAGSTDALTPWAR